MDCTVADRGDSKPLSSNDSGRRSTATSLGKLFPV